MWSEATVYVAWGLEADLPELQAASGLLSLHLAVAVLGGCRMSRGFKRAVSTRSEGTSQTDVDLCHWAIPSPRAEYSGGYFCLLHKSFQPLSWAGWKAAIGTASLDRMKTPVPDALQDKCIYIIINVLEDIFTYVRRISNPLPHSLPS